MEMKMFHWFIAHAVNVRRKLFLRIFSVLWENTQFWMRLKHLQNVQQFRFFSIRLKRKLQIFWRCKRGKAIPSRFSELCANTLKEKTENLLARSESRKENKRFMAMKNEDYTHLGLLSRIPSSFLNNTHGRKKKTREFSRIRHSW